MNQKIVGWVLIAVGILGILSELGLSFYLGAQLQSIDGSLSRVFFPLMWPSVMGMVIILVGIFFLLKKQ